MSLDGVKDAVQAGVKAAAARRQADATPADRAAVRQAAAALPQGQQQVLRQLLESLWAAISLEGPQKFEGMEGPRNMTLEGPVVRSPLWQEACLAYLGGCSKAQLSSWRWHVSAHGGWRAESGEVEVRHQGGNGSRSQPVALRLFSCSAAGCTHLHTSTLAQHIPATLPTRGCTIACLLSPLSPAHMHKQCRPSSQQLPALASTSLPCSTSLLCVLFTAAGTLPAARLTRRH